VPDQARSISKEGAYPDPMMRMTVLASGSKGNSTIVASSRTKILVDAGLSCKELLKRMEIAREDPGEIQALLITHEHQDHVQGVAVLARKLGIPVYFTEATHRAWMRWMMPHKRMTYAEWLAQRRENLARREQVAFGQASISVGDALEAQQSGPGGASVSVATLDEFVEPERLSPDEDADVHEVHEENGSVSAKEADPCALPGVEYFAAGCAFSIGDIAVTPFTIPHDAADPVGFVFEAEGIRMGMATDLGYMPPNVKMALRRCDVLMLESNHDLEMLRDGPYPWSVKQRVMSRVGHLSNDAAAEFLEKNYDGYASYVVLAHLSECNNLPELARVLAERALRDRMSLLANKLLLAEQKAPLESICF
jgi:phosphoribosyl 1,2-cyclic phosphodiesterase